MTPSVRTAARRAFSHAALEDQLRLIRSALVQVQVLADDFLEEDAAGLRTVQHLRQRELGLKNRHVVKKADLAIRWLVWVRQLGQPLPQQCVDPFRRQVVADLLQSLRIFAGGDAVVERLEGNPFLGQLPFDVFVAVDA
jgi:hypothetical protein